MSKHPTNLPPPIEDSGHHELEQPRIPKRQIGSTSFLYLNEEQLADALEDVKNHLGEIRDDHRYQSDALARLNCETFAVILRKMKEWGHDEPHGGWEELKRDGQLFADYMVWCSNGGRHQEENEQQSGCTLPPRPQNTISLFDFFTQEWKKDGNINDQSYRDALNILKLQAIEC